MTDQKRLFILMDECDIGKTELANESGVSRRTLINWKNGIVPSEELYQRAWDAAIRLANRKRARHDTMTARVQKKLGVTL